MTLALYRAPRPRPAAFVAFAAIVAFACGGFVRAQDAEQAARITEVREEATDVGVSVLINLGAASGIRPGQTVEVRRDGKPIGYGSVDKAFSTVAVAVVGTLVRGAAPLRAGDHVVFHASGFHPPELPNAGPAAGDEPTDPAPVEGARGKVVSVRDGVVLVDFGRTAGLEAGHVLSLRRANGEEIGKAVVELVSQTTAGGLLVTGEAQGGDAAVTVGRVKRPGEEAPLDFVAMDFLGAVADLEHPTPHRAACHVGVPVRRVLAGSPALRAGISRGDRIIAVGGIVVRDIASVRDRIQARRGDRVRVTLIRGDRMLEVDVDFSPR